MKNKVLVELLVPELEKSYDIYIPISKRIGNVIFLLVKAINELGIDYDMNNTIALFNRDTSMKYNPNDLVYNTDIRNGTTLILI